ncbi:hypothetical protein [Accumulibacter sp.]|uniref:hypothetical protein n=1 Tax=Accumulibacter sp. TaxID=2053492 RepID=UPI0028C3DEF1|nr:hypothetical protein [Accumulibacter sp.]
MTYKKKLIEVALPLEAINVASAREIRLGGWAPALFRLRPEVPESRPRLSSCRS